MILDTPLPIQLHNMSLDELYSNLQGNILKGHGRNHTVNIFVKFTADQSTIERWLHSYSDRITSCKKQLKENELFKDKGISGGLFATVSFTATGLRYLGADLKGFEESFRDGMKEADLNDPDPTKWDYAFQKVTSEPDRSIDALFLLAFHEEETLSREAEELRSHLGSIGIVLGTEEGHALKNENGDGLEHFGYVDGISQPLFFQKEIDEFKEDNQGLNGFDPIAANGLKQVLVADPLVVNAENENAFGSYFVFRKLEQNVKGFKRAEKELALKLQLQGEDIERAGAMIVGRFEDGSPVTLIDEDGLIDSGTLNGFDYSNDADGLKCPFHAHIRKVNSRDKKNDAERKGIMARRGIPYGKREEDSFENIDKMPEDKVGLLFQSYQSSISSQFETIQKAANNLQNGLDPIIGQDGALNKSIGGFAKIYNNSPLSLQTFDSFVTMKGGEYFFTPSLKYFKNL